LGAWVALAVASIFSTVAEEWILWPVPGIFLLGVLFIRWRRRQWPTWKNLALCSALLAAVAIGTVAIVGASSPFTVRDQGQWVKIGQGTPQVVFVVGVNAKENPRHLRTIWRATPQCPTVLWTSRPSKIGDTPIETLVLIGEPEADAVHSLVARATRVLVLAPQFAPDTIFDATTLPKAKIFIGAFTTSAHAQAWLETTRCEELPGVGDFLSDWVERSLGLPVVPSPE
jgi:hypothetical protein